MFSPNQNQKDGHCQAGAADMRAIDYSTLRRCVEELPNVPLMRGFSAPPPSDNRPCSTLEAVINQRFSETYERSIMEIVSGATGNSSPFGLPPFIGYACIKDLVRTKRFLQAIDQALDQLLKSVPESEPIRVLDAGCGPLGILGIYAALKSERVHATLVEINPDSFQFAKMNIEAWKLGERTTLMLNDASAISPDEPFHLIVSETMFSGLIAEPIVDILNPLQKKLLPEGIIIPNKVEIDFAWLRPAPSDQVGKLNIAYYGGETDNTTVQDYILGDRLCTWQPGEELTEISGLALPPQGLDPACAIDLAVTTTVHLSANLKLSGYDSSISKPVSVYDRSTGRCLRFESKPEGIQIAYEPGDDYPWADLTEEQRRLMSPRVGRPAPSIFKVIGR